MHKNCTGTWFIKTNQFSQQFDQLAAQITSGQNWSQRPNFDQIAWSKRSVLNRRRNEGISKPHWQETNRFLLNEFEFIHAVLTYYVSIYLDNVFFNSSNVPCQQFPVKFTADHKSVPRTVLRTPKINSNFTQWILIFFKVCITNSSLFF